MFTKVYIYKNMASHIMLSHPSFSSSLIVIALYFLVFLAFYLRTNKKTPTDSKKLTIETTTAYRYTFKFDIATRLVEFNL